MNYLIIGLILGLILFGTTFSMWYIVKSAQKIHEKLNDLEEKARLAKNKDELQKIWTELRIVNKECWHKSFSEKSTEVKTILVTRFEMMTN